MTDPDRPAFAALLADVLGFYGKATSPFAMRVWWEACKPFDLAAVSAAMTRHATDPKHGHFAPMPADVIRQLRGDADDAALLAWGEVLRVARAGGSGVTELPVATQQALQELGGIAVVQRAEEGENGFLQRRFVDAFQACRRRDDAALLLAVGNQPQARLQ